MRGGAVLPLDRATVAILGLRLLLEEEEAPEAVIHPGRFIVVAARGRVSVEARGRSSPVVGSRAAAVEGASRTVRVPKRERMVKV